MIPESSPPTEKKNFWRRLTAPHPLVKDFTERRFSSVLATLLLALLPLYFLPEGIRAILEHHSTAQIIYFIVGTLVLLGAYLLARSPRPRWGAVLTISYFMTLPFLALVVQSERYAEAPSRALIWSVPIMMLALILFHPKDVKWFVLLQIGISLLVPALWNQITFADVSASFFMVVAVGGLMIVSAYVQGNYLRRVAFEAQQNKTVKERYAALFDSSPVALWELDLSKIKKALDAYPGEVAVEDIQKYALFLRPILSRLPLSNINQAAIELFEAPNAEHAKQNWLEVTDIGDSLFTLMEQVLLLWRDGEFFTYELDLKTFSGKKITVLLKTSMIDEAQKDWSSIILSAVDITERKKAEKRLQDLFLSSPIALFEADFSAIKTRLDTFEKEYGDVKDYILENPQSMQGAGKSVRLLDANLQAVALYDAEDTATLLTGLRFVVDANSMLALRDGVIALWEGHANLPLETVHKTLKGEEKTVVIRFSVRSGYEDTWEYINISVGDITQRRAAEASARQLASAVEASASSVQITDKNGIIEYVNTAFSEISGYTQEEVLGKKPSILSSGLHAPEYYAEIWNSLLAGEAWHGELVNRAKNGELFWEMATIAPVLDERGETINYVAIKDDITTLKETERSLRDSEEKFRSFFANSTEGIKIYDSQGYIIEWNDAMSKIQGIPREKALGMHGSEIEFMKDPPEKQTKEHLEFIKKDWHDTFQAIKEGGEYSLPSQDLFTMHRPDGSVRIAMQSFFVIKTENDFVVGAVAGDVTKQQEREAEIRKLSQAVVASASSIVITDTDGAIEYVNPAFIDKTGYSAAEALGENPRVLKSGQHPAEFYTEMWQTLATGETWQGELINKKKSGELYWERANISPLRNEQGETTHYVAVKDDISAAKEAEEQLRQQREFLKIVMDGIDSPFYVLNVDDYSIELANKAARKSGVATAKTCYALTHRNDAPCSGNEHPCPLKHVVEHKEPFVVEHVHYREDGSKYDVEVHGYPIYDAAGNVVQMIEYSLDISARKEAERELRKLSRAVEQAASGIVITNVDSIIEYANPAAAKITGYAFEEFIGQTPNVLKSGMHEEEFYENLWRTIERGDTWRGELINKRKDGSLYWESQIITPVRNTAGKVTHYVAVKEDVTEAREIKERLQTLSSAVEQSASAVVITDPEGRIEFINPAFTKMTDYLPEEAVGEKVGDLIASNEHPPEFYANLHATIRQGNTWIGELINRRKDGSLYWESTAISPIYDPEGNFTHIVEVKEDITRRKELENALALAHEEALVASDMKTQLLANVSHDMRTPLGAILGYTEMLQGGLFEPLNKDQEGAMRAISASTQRLLDFVNNLLSQAQIDTGKIVLNQAAFNPQKLVTSMGGELAFARSKGLNIETEICKSMPKTLYGDAYWLGQILHNLVSNAIKFTPEGGSIHIKLCRQDQKQWSLSVADTGKGIPPEAQEYIFDSFRQVDGSIHREVHTGSGLGLSIVSDLVRLMEGSIELDSEINKGSTFRIILPLKENA